MEPSEPAAQSSQMSTQQIENPAQTIKTPLLIGGFAILLLFVSGISFLAGRGSVTFRDNKQDMVGTESTTIPTSSQDMHNQGIPTTTIVALPTIQFQISPNPTFPLPTAEPQSTARITRLNPASGPIGTRVAIYGSGFTSTNTIYFNSNQNGNGVSGAYTEPSSQGGTVIYFTIPEKDNPTCPNNTACPIRPPSAVVPGEYRIGLFNSEHGFSNQLPFTVTQ